MGQQDGDSHAEAFCLMWYQCEDETCGYRHRIWNSRDGVTPFYLGSQCPQCGGDMHHVDFQLDEYRPDYVPVKDQWVFIDFPESFIEPIAQRRARQLHAAGIQTARDVLSDVRDATRQEYEQRAPWLTVWPWERNE